jgi:multicomponent Na+:H+ antiporter subunit E
MTLLRLLTPRRLWKALHFALFYIWEIVLSNFRVAHDVLTPRDHFRPGILAIRLPDLSDIQLIALTNLVTMTPGTICMDVTDDRHTLYIHSMYIDDPEKMRKQICQDYITRIREIFP